MNPPQSHEPAFFLWKPNEPGFLKEPNEPNCAAKLAMEARDRFNPTKLNGPSPRTKFFSETVLDSARALPSSFPHDMQTHYETSLKWAAKVPAQPWRSFSEMNGW
jgi:hypothetical protein